MYLSSYAGIILKQVASIWDSDTDKVKLTGLTPMAAGPSMAYSEARMIVVCKKIYGDKIKGDCATDPGKAKSLNATEDYHKLYFGEITGVWVKKE